MKWQVEAVANQLNNASIIENVLSLQKMANGTKGTQCRKVRNFASFGKKLRENNLEGNLLQHR